MKWFNNLKISRKLVISFLLVALISGAIGFVGAYNLNKDNSSNVFVMMIIYIIITCLISISLGMALSRLIDKPLEKLVKIARELNIGDLDVSIDIDTKEEIGALSEELGKIAENLREHSNATSKLAQGNLDIHLKEKSEKDVLSKNLNLVIENIKLLVADANMLENAAVEGRLSVRGDASKHNGDYRKVIEGVNNTLDAIITPFNEAMEVLGNMSLNDYSINMKGNYFGALALFSEKINLVRDRLLSVQDIAARVSKGDISRLEEFRKIGKRSDNDMLLPSFKDMMETIKNLIDEVNNLTAAASEGNLKKRGDAGRFEGGYKEIIIGLNNIMETISIPIQEAENVLNKMAVNDISTNMKGEYKGEFKNLSESINFVYQRLLSIQDAFVRVAKGDTSRLAEVKQIGKRSDNDVLLPAMIRMMEAVQGLIYEVKMISDSATQGNLSFRGDQDKFEGGYKEIITGFNNTLDSIIVPVNEALGVLSNMAVNDYTAEMKGKYSGTLAQMAETVNSVRTRLLSVQDIAMRVSKGDTSRLEEFRNVGKRSENDRMLPAFREMMETIEDLTAEVNALTFAAAEGDLKTRGDAAKFEGGYKTIITGFNNALDSIEVPLNEVMEVLGKMSVNDYTFNVNSSYKGAFQNLAEAVNNVIDTLNNVLSKINSAASQVASASKQVSGSAQQLSQSSTEQASAIEELSASIEEISSQTKQNAGNASMANEFADTAKIDALNGNDQMKKMLESMQEINQASNSISKIIKVIDEIAFQTNILALNAAVEAARAGQYGKGFAVVAEEVRNLAARSAKAAKETTGLIEGSINKVEEGTKIANNTADALGKIVGGVTKAADLVKDIASASNEQASAIVQINQGIMQVSQVTQTNSATAEESAAASEELSGQAEILNEMVGRFTLSSEDVNQSDLDGLSPDVVKMLEKVSKRKKHGVTDNQKVSKGKISLSERDYGKY